MVPKKLVTKKVLDLIGEKEYLEKILKYLLKLISRKFTQARDVKGWALLRGKQIEFNKMFVRIPGQLEGLQVMGAIAGSFKSKF